MYPRAARALSPQGNRNFEAQRLAARYSDEKQKPFVLTVDMATYTRLAKVDSHTGVLQVYPFNPLHFPAERGLLPPPPLVPTLGIMDNLSASAGSDTDTAESHEEKLGEE